MSVIQAALIALAYAFARSSFNAGLGWYVLSQPLVAGTIAGLMLGDPLRGAALGGALNLASLALSSLKLKFDPDLALVGYIGVPWLLLNGLNTQAPQTAIILAGLLSLGWVLYFLRNMGNIVLAHWADYFAEGGEFAALSAIHILIAQLWSFIIAFVPALLLLRLDQKMVMEAIAGIPFWIQQAIWLSQYFLAALGIALSLKVIMQGSAIAYFVLGWLIAQYLGLVQATLFGASMAVIHAYLARRRMEANKEMLVPDALPADAEADEIESPRVLAPVHLTSSFFLWMFFHGASENFERGQNMGFATALAPIGQRLCDNVLERASFMRRHLTLFLSAWPVGGVLVAATAALEERRANGDPINEAELAGAKSSLMGSLLVLGDLLLNGVFTSFLVAVGATLAMRPSLLGPMFFVIVQSMLVIGVALFCFQFGYLQTRHWATWARANDWLRAGLFGAVRLGAFVLGVVLILYVPLELPPQTRLYIGSASISLAERLDQFAPKILPLLLTLWLWWQLRYRRVGDMTLMIGCVLAAFGICIVSHTIGWL